MTASPDGHRLQLHVLSGTVAVCRLEATADVPSWAQGELVSITRTSDELSIVCDDAAVPAGLQSLRGYSAIAVAGPLAPELVGVLASIASPLAQVAIPIVAIGTFDTDYVLVRAADLAMAIVVLRAVGHTIRDPSSAP